MKKKFLSFVIACLVALPCVFFMSACDKKHVHTYEYDDDYHWYTCGCNAEQVVHSWDDGVVNLEPTMNSRGVMTFTCTICKKTRVEAIPPLEKNTPYIATIPSLDKTYDGVAVSITAPETDSDGAMTIEWYEGTTKLDAAPSTVGSYKVVVSLAETDYYKAGSVEKIFTISKATPIVSANTYLNKTYDALPAVMASQPTSNSDGEITIEYYQGNTRLDTAPTNAGDYILVINIEETDTFAEYRQTSEFTISKRERPTLETNFPYYDSINFFKSLDDLEYDYPTSINEELKAELEIYFEDAAGTRIDKSNITTAGKYAVGADYKAGFGDNYRGSRSIYSFYYVPDNMPLSTTTIESTAEVAAIKGCDTAYLTSVQTTSMEGIHIAKIERNGYNSFSLWYKDEDISSNSPNEAALRYESLYFYIYAENASGELTRLEYLKIETNDGYSVGGIADFMYQNYIVQNIPNNAQYLYISFYTDLDTPVYIAVVNS